ncbi:MAG TPA: PTS fructose transporter subunit IIA [Deltaproteobacteria bacterium]|nr:PTS fructose transporter subunit IIA [Deltaproteobacteria bacterium]
MRIEDILLENCVISEIQSKTKKGVLNELIGVLKEANLISSAQDALRVIEEREKFGSTGIGDGVAIPHGKMKGIDTFLCAFGRSPDGIDFDAVDKKPVHLFFLLIAPENSVSIHLKLLSRITKILRDSLFRKKLMELKSAHEIYLHIIEEDKKI